MTINGLASSCTTNLDRGGTAILTTTFYDQYGNVTQPPGAVMNLVFTKLDGTQGNASLSMTSPIPPIVTWTAEWDTRNVAPGSVWASVHSTGPGIPYAVEDFRFTLGANNANVPTF